jgi:hypothetical protein
MRLTASDTRFPSRTQEKTMCDIGKPVEMIDVEPLSLPAPLRKQKETPVEQPVTAEVPVSAETPVTVEKL